MKGFVLPPLNAGFRSMMFYLRNAQNLNKKNTSKEIGGIHKALYRVASVKVYQDTNKTSLKQRTSEPAPYRINGLTLDPKRGKTTLDRLNSLV
jgi:hypothetical protein